MLLGAAAIGLLTAYYFGLRVGAYAAGVAAALFAVAFLLPAWSLAAYGAVAVGVVGVCVIGPRRAKKGAPQELVGWARKLAMKLLRRSRQ